MPGQILEHGQVAGLPVRGQVCDQHLARVPGPLGPLQHGQRAAQVARRQRGRGEQVAGGGAQGAGEQLREELRGRDRQRARQEAPAARAALDEGRAAAQRHDGQPEQVEPRARPEQAMRAVTATGRAVEPPGGDHGVQVAHAEHEQHRDIVGAAVTRSRSATPPDVARASAGRRGQGPGAGAGPGVTRE